MIKFREYTIFCKSYFLKTISVNNYSLIGWSESRVIFIFIFTLSPSFTFEWKACPYDSTSSIIAITNVFLYTHVHFLCMCIGTTQKRGQNQQVFQQDNNCNHTSKSTHSWRQSTREFCSGSDWSLVERSQNWCCNRACFQNERPGAKKEKSKVLSGLFFEFYIKLYVIWICFLCFFVLFQCT